MGTMQGRLRRVFSEILVAACATTTAAGVAVGCGGGTDGGASSSSGGSSSGGDGPTPDFTSLCDVENVASLLAGLRASPEIDGAVMRTEHAFPLLESAGGNEGGVVNPDEPADGWKATSGETVGALCSKASNQAACLATVEGFRVLPPTREECTARFPVTPYTGMTCGVTYILYTRGDEIGVAVTDDETRALIGTFDTVHEAFWAASKAGYQRSCASNGGERSTYRTRAGGHDLTLLEYQNCGPELARVVVHVDAAGNVSVLSREVLPDKPPCAVAGRRPDGLCVDEITTRGGANAVGEHLAAMATLEAASVVAFRRLYRRLQELGAPRELLDRIRKAARDEIRHARAVGALARAYGVAPRAPRIERTTDAPTLLAIGLENAREGQVRETFGALVAHVQAARARDANVRAVMATIAEEETQHAELSWDIAEWIESRLGDEDRARLARVRREAFDGLARELGSGLGADVEDALGMPAPAEARRLLDALGPTLLAA